MRKKDKPLLHFTVAIINTRAHKICFVKIEMNKLKHTISFPHGSFFFGKDSHHLKIPESDVFDHSLSWTSLQRELLDDSDINVEEEKKRCASYNFGFPNATIPLRRRRLFYGALIAADSTEVIKATSMEQYNIFHTVRYLLLKAILLTTLPRTSGDSLAPRMRRKG